MAEEVLRLGIDPGQAIRGSKRFQGAAAASSASAGNLAKAVGVAGAAMAAFAASRQIGAAVDGLIKFDSAMTQSLAIMGDVDDSMRNQMAQSARQVGQELNFAAEEGAEAFFFLASAGLDAEQSLAALPAVAEFARAGMFDLSTATDLATDAQSALGLASSDAQVNLANMTRVTDTLVKANTLANATVEQFSTALTTEAGAAMKTFSIDVEEGAAVLAAFADQGIKGQRAGSGFSRILRLMSQAAVNNQEAMDRLGIEFFDAEGNMRNMADVVANLTNVLGSMSDKQRAAALESIGFTARVQGIIQPLLGTSEAIREYEAGLRDAAGTTKEVAENQMLSLENRIGNIQQEFRNWRTEMVEGAVPAIEAVIENTDDAVDAAQSLAVAIGAAGAAGAFVAAGRAAQAYAATLTVLIARHGAAKTAAATLGTVLGAISWPVVAVTAFAGVLFTTKQRMREAAEEAEELEDALDKATDSITAMGEEALRVQIAQFTVGIQRAEEELGRLNEKLEEAEKSEGRFGTRSAQVRVEIERQQNKIADLEELLLAAARGYTSLSDTADDAADDVDGVGDAAKRSAEELEKLLSVVEDLSQAEVGNFGRGGGLAVPGGIGQAGVSRSTGMLRGPTAGGGTLGGAAFDITDILGISDLPDLEPAFTNINRRLSQSIFDEFNRSFKINVEDNLIAAFDKIDKAAGSLPKLDATVRGLVAMGSAFGDLDEATEGALRGVSDMIGGITTMRKEGASTAEQVAGGAGLVGGIVSLASAFLGAGESADQLRRKVRAAAEEFDLALAEFAGTATEQDRIIAQAAGLGEDIFARFDGIGIKAGISFAEALREGMALEDIVDVDGMAFGRFLEQMGLTAEEAFKRLEGDWTSLTDTLGTRLDEAGDQGHWFNEVLDRIQDEASGATDALGNFADEWARVTDDAPGAFADEFQKSIDLRLQHFEEEWDRVTGRTVGAFADEFAAQRKMLEEREGPEKAEDAVAEERDRTRRATSGGGGSSQVISQITGIRATQAARMSDILTSINVHTRETAINTRPIRGGADIPLGQVGARATMGPSVQVFVTIEGNANRDDAEEIGRQVADQVDSKLGGKLSKEKVRSGDIRL